MPLAGLVFQRATRQSPAGGDERDSAGAEVSCHFGAGVQSIGGPVWLGNTKTLSCATTSLLIG